MRHLILSFLLLIAVSAIGQPPTIPASNIAFTSVKCNEFTVSWTNGNGTYRIVFIKEGSSIGDIPVENEFYSSSSIFGKGESIKNDNTHFCVYRGTSNTVTVTGLKNNTKYFVAVFEYNANVGSYNYLTSTYPKNDTTTKNIVANGYVYDIRQNGQKGQCLNSNSFQFKNKSSSDITPVTYSWKFGDGDSSNINEPKHSYKSIGIKNVILIVRANGCYSSFTFNDTVYPHPVAKFNFESSDTIQCWYGNMFNFKNKSTLVDIGAGISSMRYFWYEVPNTIHFSTRYNADCTFITSGKKTIKLVAESNNGCKDSVYSSKIFTVLPKIIDPFKISISHDSLPLKNNKFTLTNINTKTWQIRNKNNPSFKDSIRGISVNYSFKAVGRYYISFDTIDTKTGCYDKYLDSVEVTKDLRSISNTISETISIYPNPSHSGVFHINYIPVNASLKVFSIIGEELLTLNPLEVNSEINLNRFGAGTYILSLWSEGRKLDYRLVVLKP